MLPTRIYSRFLGLTWERPSGSIGVIRFGIFTAEFNLSFPCATIIGDKGGWWNGRHAGLKIPCSQECESSNLSPPTKLGLGWVRVRLSSEARKLVRLRRASSLPRD